MMAFARREAHDKEDCVLELRKVDLRHWPRGAGKPPEGEPTFSLTVDGVKLENVRGYTLSNPEPGEIATLSVELIAGEIHYEGFANVALRLRRYVRKWWGGVREETVDVTALSDEYIRSA